MLDLVLILDILANLSKINTGYTGKLGGKLIQLKVSNTDDSAFEPGYTLPKIMKKQQLFVILLRKQKQYVVWF